MKTFLLIVLAGWLLLQAGMFVRNAPAREGSREAGGVSNAAAPEFQLTETEWKARLSPEAYRVLREHGTERAYSGKYWDHKKEGIYQCGGCQADLFSSGDQFDSGTGWPSYTRPLSETAVGTQKDRTLFMVRTEVHCARCKGHLGHVFEDGPEPTGLRYCINSVALIFQPTGEDGLAP